VEAGIVLRTWKRAAGLVAAGAVLAACAPAQATQPAGSAPVGAPTVTAIAGASPTPRPTQDFTVRDGEAWIGFQWVAGPGDGIFLVRRDGTGRHRLASAPGSQIHPDWSPDGTQIAYVTVTPADRTELWIVDADGSDARSLFSCVAPCNQVSYPDWAPDGRSIYFGLDADASADAPPTTFRVARYDLGTEKTTIVLERRDGMSAEQPRISPDGTQVVYARFRETAAGVNSAIFVADLKGGPEHRLTDWELLGAYPDWSIEDLIVFNTRDLGVFQDTTAPANLYTVAIDGSDLRQLTTFGSSDTRATQPRWLDDGTGIAFTQVDGAGFGERRLAYIAGDGSGLTWLTPSPIDGTHPQLRPFPE
jgi:Tol biopolymer transport system component